MSFLLDTNVLSERRRPRPEQKVVYLVSAPPLEGLFISTVTVAEIRIGITSKACTALRAPIGRNIFEGLVMLVSEDVLFKWGLLVGHTFPQTDLIVAATGFPAKITSAVISLVFRTMCAVKALGREGIKIFPFAQHTL